MTTRHCIRVGRSIQSSTWPARPLFAGVDDKGVVALDGIGDRAQAPHRCYAGYESCPANARPQGYDLSTAGFGGVSSTQGTG